MWVNLILLLAIAGYAFWVVRRKIRKFKAGEYCDCGCGGCSSASKCKKQNVD